MMEGNPTEAVMTNVMGIKHLSDISIVDILVMLTPAMGILTPLQGLAHPSLMA